MEHWEVKSDENLKMENDKKVRFLDFISDNYDTTIRKGRNLGESERLWAISRKEIFTKEWRSAL